jgi:hypothetical protein
MNNVKNRKRYLGLAQRLRQELADLGIDTKIKTVASWGSVYITCDDERMGQIRVGDHDERERYGYRWQLRTDIHETKVDTAKGHRQFFFPASDVKEMAFKMKAYQEAILRNAAREKT